MISDEAVEAARDALWNAPAGLASVTDLPDETVRLILEAAAPHMLATVSTVAELDALPRFTVIRSDEGAVFERQTMWHEAGSRDLIYSPGIALPATVLQLGWGDE